jgi:hypothetical protein
MLNSHLLAKTPKLQEAAGSHLAPLKQSRAA